MEVIMKSEGLELKANMASDISIDEFVDTLARLTAALYGHPIELGWETP